MLEALAAGRRDPHALAEPAHANIKASRAELAEALTGRFTDHHGYLVTDHLDESDPRAQKGTSPTGRDPRPRGDMAPRNTNPPFMPDMAVAIFSIPHDKVPTRDLAPDNSPRRDPAKIRRRITALARSIGATVDI